MVSASDWGSEGRRFESAYPDLTESVAGGGFAVYVLQSRRTGRRYVGSTQDIQERLRRHNAGHSKSTKAGVPWVLVHSEPMASRSEAAKRELWLKSGVGRAWLDELLG